MIARLWSLSLLGLLAACEPPSPPPPPLAILNVTPLSQRSNETKTVQVQLNADPVFQVNYSQSAAHQVDAPVLQLGYRSVPLTYLGKGLFEASVEPLGAASYSVGVRLDGREATYDQAYEVTSLQYSYDFEGIEPQVRGRPFPVHINVSARGKVTGEPASAHTATLTIFKGSKDVFTSPLTIYGTEKVHHYAVVNELGDDFVARIVDSEGEKAYSTTFPVSESPLQQ